MKTITLQILFLSAFVAGLKAQTLDFQFGISSKQITNNNSFSGDEWNFTNDWVLKADNANFILKAKRSTNDGLNSKSLKVTIGLMPRTATTAEVTKSFSFTFSKSTGGFDEFKLVLDFFQQFGPVAELKMNVKTYINNTSNGEIEKNIKRTIR